MNFFIFFFISFTLSQTLCKPKSLICSEGFDTEECTILQLSSSFTIDADCKNIIQNIQEIQFNGNVTIYIDKDFEFEQKVVIQKNSQVSFEQEITTFTKELKIEKDSFVKMNILQTKHANVEINGKIEIEEIISFSEESKIYFNDNSKIKITKGNLQILNATELTTGKEVEFKIENNVIVFDTSKVTFGEKNIMNVENQLQIQDKAIMIFGKENRIDVKGYYLTATQNSQLTFGEKSLIECDNLYIYFDTLVTIEDGCTFKSDNIFLFQQAKFVVKNDVKMDIRQQISSYSIAKITIGKNMDLKAKHWYILYNTTVAIGDESSFLLNSFEIGGYTDVTIGKNVSFEITANHLSPVCKEDKSQTFCYSAIIRGAAHVTIDNVKNHRPLFKVHDGNVVQWNTTRIEFKNNDIVCYDFYSFREPFGYKNEVEKTEYSLHCGKKLGRYCVDKKVEEIVCQDGWFHCPCIEDETNVKEL